MIENLHSPDTFHTHLGEWASANVRHWGILSFIDQHFICLMPTGATNLIAVKILFFLVSRYENLGELCMHFELKSAASGPIWLKFGQIVFRWVTYKTVTANFNSSFQSYSLFFTGSSNNFSSPNVLFQKISMPLSRKVF